MTDWVDGCCICEVGEQTGWTDTIAVKWIGDVVATPAVTECAMMKNGILRNLSAGNSRLSLFVMLNTSN